MYDAAHNIISYIYIPLVNEFIADGTRHSSIRLCMMDFNMSLQHVTVIFDNSAIFTWERLSGNGYLVLTLVYFTPVKIDKVGSIRVSLIRQLILYSTDDEPSYELELCPTRKKKLCFLSFIFTVSPKRKYTLLPS